MAIEFKPVVTGGLAKQIATNIRDAILEGRLKVNDRLPTEDELAARFGVSRPTIREALKRLAAQNLVRSRRGPAGGTFVTKPTEDEVRATLQNITSLMVSLREITFPELADARRNLELMCCRLAAERRNDADLAAMRRELDIQSDPTADDISFCYSDLRFHKCLVEATQNPLLRLLMIALIESLQAVSNMVSYPFRARQTIVDQHRRIYAAISARDATEAARAIDDQMSYLMEVYAEARRRRGEAV